MAGIKDRIVKRLASRSFPWAVAGALALMAPLAGVAAWLATLAEYRTSPPNCYGIGWGCSLSPVDSGIFVGALWLFAISVIAGVLGITELFWSHVAELRSAVMLVALGFGTVLLVILAVEGLTIFF